EPNEQLEGLAGEPVLGEIDEDARQIPGEPGRPSGIGGEELTNLHRLELLAVGGERLPGGGLGEVHGCTWLSASSPAAPRSRSQMRFCDAGWTRAAGSAGLPDSISAKISARREALSAPATRK